MSRDDGGKQVLADDHEQRERDDEDRDRLGVLDIADARDEDTGSDQASSQQQPHRDEQQQRVVEVAAQAIAAATTLGHQAEREPHQGAEGSLECAEKHRGTTQQEKSEWGHPLSIKPSRSPPRLRRRRSSRAMRPSSRS